VRVARALRRGLEGDHRLLSASSAEGSHGVISRLDLPAEPASPGRARRFVASALAGVPADVDLAALLVSELVTNAVLHARTPLEVVVETNPDSVEVSVHDGSRVRPALRRYDRDAATGRGLHLVEKLADRWGVDLDAGTKRVWFALAVPSARSDGRATAASARRRRRAPKPRARREEPRRRRGGPEARV
jgi:anti-sigma regulatory factor (Ser/Thr protein kinase)